MEEKAFGLRISVITWVISVMEGRKKGVIGISNWKEYYNISKARKVRLEMKASYCNIFKVS